MKCTRVGCISKSIKKGLCSKHQPSSNLLPQNDKSKRIRKDYHNLYNTTAWKRLRLQLLSRRPICQRCKKYNKITTAIDVDHIQEHKGNRDLFFNINNLQALCKSCHSWKTNMTRLAATVDLDFSGYF